MTQDKKKRKFVTLPMTVPEFESLNNLIVAIVARDGRPVDRTEVIREAVDILSERVTGRQIFAQQA